MRQIQCRGQRLWDLMAPRTAVISIDMQVDFLDRSGRSAAKGRDLGLMRAVIPKVVRLLAWARKEGLKIWHTRKAHLLGDPDVYPVLRTHGHALIADCAPQAGESVLDKAAFSAFHGTDLAEQLHGAGISHLILCGVTSSCCVQATLRAAVDHGFTCLTVADACASFELDDHDRSLDLIVSENHVLGDVCDLEALAGPVARPLADGIRIRAMMAADGPDVMAIYAAGIEAGGATFATGPGRWEKFDANKLQSPRLVAESAGGAVLGFAVLSPISARSVYRGICEVTLYRKATAAGKGIGHALLSQLIAQSEQAGIWTLTAGIFPQNTASLLLHAANGFRCLGRQVGAGQLQIGPDAGSWADVLRLERRSETVGQ